MPFFRLFKRHFGFWVLSAMLNVPKDLSVVYLWPVFGANGDLLAERLPLTEEKQLLKDPCDGEHAAGVEGLLGLRLSASFECMSFLQNAQILWVPGMPTLDGLYVEINDMSFQSCLLSMRQQQKYYWATGKTTLQPQIWDYLVHQINIMWSPIYTMNINGCKMRVSAPQLWMTPSPGTLHLF